MTQRQFVGDLFASYEPHLSFAFRVPCSVWLQRHLFSMWSYICAVVVTFSDNFRQNFGLRTIRTIMGLASYCVTSRKEGRTHV